MQYQIMYICPECGESWEEIWECPCNSECPECECEDIEPASYRLLSPPTEETA